MRHDHCAHHIPFPAVLPDRVTGIAAYPVLQVFRRYATFRVALGFAQLPRQLLAFRNSGFSLLRGSIRLGLMVVREFIRTIYDEAEIHESGAFEKR